MHDQIEILDIEKKTQSFKVVFEVPGKHYDQDYPKRMAHSFPMEPHLLEKDENGDYRFEKSLRQNYLKDKETKEKKEKAEKEIDKVRNDVRRKKLE